MPDRWTQAELDTLAEIYPKGGIHAAMEALPGRPRLGIYVKASLLKLRVRRPIPAPKPKLRGRDLETAIALHYDEGWGFERIGKRFGLSEIGVQNAVLIEKSKRDGHRPIERDEGGNILPAGRERLRYALRLGMTGSEISYRLGVSAALVSRERRDYDAELRSAGKVPLPPPGKGKHYSGRKLTKAEKAEIERLLMKGLGALKISERTGLSKTSVGRVRKRLVARLARKKQTLIGCDLTGKRHGGYLEHSCHVHPKRKAKLRELLLQGWTVAAACRESGMARTKADEVAHAMRDAGEYETKRCGRDWHSSGKVESQPFWPPVGRGQHARLNVLLETMEFDEAKAVFVAERAQADRDRAEAEKIERERPKTFEDQLAAVRAGASLTRALPRNHLDTTVLRPEERPAA